MRNSFKTHIVFWSKSLMWSALLYGALMLLFNWDEVVHKTNNNATLYSVSIDSSSTTHTSAVASIYSVLSCLYCNIVSKQ